MRDATEKLVGDAVADALLSRGGAEGTLTTDTVNDRLVVG